MRSVPDANAMPPAAFREQRDGDHWLMLASDYGDALKALELDDPEKREALIFPAATAAAETPAHTTAHTAALGRGMGRGVGRGVGRGMGRAATRILALPDRDERLLLRRTLHGGWLAPLWRGGLAGIGRLRSELAVTERLRARGAPVPRPVFALALRRGGLWHGALATRHEPTSQNGLEVLRSGTPASDLAAAAGTATRLFHDAGGHHADLHLGNLLMRPACPEHGPAAAWVIDLDRACAGHEPTPVHRRLHELRRLRRSLAKWRLQDQLGAQACADFFAAYCDGDPALDRALGSLLRTPPR